MYYFEQEISTFKASYPPNLQSKLFIIDFDSTLFKSPLPNPTLWSPKLRAALISDLWWFSEKMTLEPPYLSKVPSAEWWNEEMIEIVKNAGCRSGNLVVLLTGRKRAVFDERIKELLKGAGLVFDFVFCKEEVEMDDLSVSKQQVQDGQDRQVEEHIKKLPKEFNTTLDFKFAVLDTLLLQFPHLKHVNLFDDRHQHCTLFINKFEDLKITRGVSCCVKLVRIGEMFMEEGLERELVYELIDIYNKRIEVYESRVLGEILIEDPLESDLATGGKQMFSKESGIVEKTILEDAQQLSISTPITKNPPENYTVKKLKVKKASISMFRKKIELIEHVSFLGIFLDNPSKQSVLSAFPLPPDWKVKCDHMTVSFARADLKMIEKLGGLGSTHKLTATHIGTINESCTALKIDPAGLVSENDPMHITLFISPKGQSKQSNSITDWTKLDTPLILSGTLNKKVVIGMPSDIRIPVVKMQVSIGTLVLKHHPHLQGKNVGIIVKHVNEWMGKLFVENMTDNQANIEYFIQSIDALKVLASV